MVSPGQCLRSVNAWWKNRVLEYWNIRKSLFLGNQFGVHLIAKGFLKGFLQVLKIFRLLKFNHQIFIIQDLEPSKAIDDLDDLGGIGCNPSFHSADEFVSVEGPLD